MTRKLVCAKHFDPAVFMGENWSAAEEDERAERLPEIDVSAIALVSCLKRNVGRFWFTQYEIEREPDERQCSESKDRVADNSHPPEVLHHRCR